MAKKGEKPVANKQSPPARIETVEELAAAYPDLVGQVQVQMTCQTAEELIDLYPELVDTIKEDVSARTAEAAGAMSAEQIEINMPQVYATVAAAVTPKAQRLTKVAGFALEVDDPFGDGALRAYAKANNINPPRLPYTLPYKDPASKKAVQSYMLRADGAGDTKRAEAASKALAKCK